MQTQKYNKASVTEKVQEYYQEEEEQQRNEDMITNEILEALQCLKDEE